LCAATSLDLHTRDLPENKDIDMGFINTDPSSLVATLTRGVGGERDFAEGRW
jgi:hypothetical protein